MKKNIFYFIFVLCLQLSLANTAKATDLVILIPGTLTDLIPSSGKDLKHTHYFSNAILETISNRGYYVEVMEGLLPTGDLTINCNIAENKVQQLYKKWQGKISNVILLGHSMGGLLSLCVSSRNTDLPISKNILIATPLEGSFVAEHAFTNPLWGDWLIDLAYDLSTFWDFRGLTELTQEKVNIFIKELLLPDDLKIYLATGSQKASELPFIIYDADYLSPIMAIASLDQEQDSDGIISVNSALGIHTNLKTISGKNILLNRLSQDIGFLDHAKQVIDYHWFLGCTNQHLIEKRQRQFYTQVFNIVENEK